MNGRAADALLGSYLSGSNSHQQERWTFQHGALSSAAQPLNPEGSIDQQRHSEPSINAIHEPEESLPLDEFGGLEAAYAWDHDVRTARSAAQQLRPALVIGALFAALGTGWIGGSYFHGLAPVPAALEQKPNCSDRALDSGKTNCVTRKADREAIPGAPITRKIATPTAAASSGGHETSHSAAQQAAASTNTVTLAKKQNTTLPGTSAVAILHEESVPRLAPMPETKPGTIEGWTVRDVIGGSAVLEGPDGISRAAVGDTVPGLGKVDSIVLWGNRWIVATSRGLISTR